MQSAVVQTRLTGSAKVELPNLYPARPHYGPEDFARTLRALSGVLEANPGAAGRVLEGVRAGKGEKDFTLQRNSQEIYCNVTQFEKPNIRER